MNNVEIHTHATSTYLRENISVRVMDFDDVNYTELECEMIVYGKTRELRVDVNDVPMGICSLIRSSRAMNLDGRARLRKGKSNRVSINHWAVHSD